MLVLQQFKILFSLGSLGIVLVAIVSIPDMQQQLATLPTAEAPPLWVPLIINGLLTSVLLAIAILLAFSVPAP